jgi:hypothetical protein
MTKGTLAVFLGGFFFGGAMDHVILALAGRADTPYGIHAGVAGNWVMAALDLAATLGCWIAYRRFDRRVVHRA